MTVFLPTSLSDLYHDLTAVPEAHLLAGGTDLMVEVNYGHRRPDAVISLRNVTELCQWRVADDVLHLGASVTWSTIEGDEIAALVPALAQAARTVGSPQIRNAGTVGGNVGTASPAGDGLPVLYALEARLVLGSQRGRRTLLVSDFITGPKRTQIAADEVIESFEIPILRGPQHFSKIGARNAMVISTAGLALIVDADGRNVRCALGSVGPTILRAPEAEVMISGLIDWEAPTGPSLRSQEAIIEFGELVAQAARPIDDHRSTAKYRRHAVDVMARRALMRCL